MDENEIKALKDNSRKAFEKVYREYAPRLYRFAEGYVMNAQEAEDIVQDAFLRFLEALPALPDTTDVGNYLYSTVKNLCLNYLKHHMLANYLSIDYLSTLDGEEKLYSADLMFSTDENILYEDLKTQIDAALSKLSPRSREIFLLSRFDGMKNKEIAELLGISTTAVEKHISKSLKVISDYLKDNSSYYQYIVIMSFFLFTK